MVFSQINYLKNSLSYIFRLFSALSFDVALGATSSAYFAFTVCYHHEINQAHFLSLFFSILFFYSADHLYDLYRTRNTERSERRNFHASLRTVFIILAIVSFAAILPLIFVLDLHVIYSGFILAAGVGIYFFFINTYNSNRYKDILVAFGYTLGIWVPVFSYQLSNFDYSFLLPTLLFFLNTFVTMLLYAFYDIQSDKSEGIESFFSRFSVIQAKIIVKWAVLVNATISFLLFSLTSFTYLLPLFLHALLLVLITFYAHLNPTKVRWIGEYSYVIYFVWAVISVSF